MGLEDVTDARQLLAQPLVIANAPLPALAESFVAGVLPPWVAQFVAVVVPLPPLAHVKSFADVVVLPPPEALFADVVAPPLPLSAGPLAGAPLEGVNWSTVES